MHEFTCTGVFNVKPAELEQPQIGSLKPTPGLQPGPVSVVKGNNFISLIKISYVYLLDLFKVVLHFFLLCMHTYFTSALPQHSYKLKPIRVKLKQVKDM